MKFGLRDASETPCTTRAGSGQWLRRAGVLDGRAQVEALLSAHSLLTARDRQPGWPSRTELSHHQSNNQEAKALSLKSKMSTTLPPHTKSTLPGGDVGAEVSLVHSVTP